MVTAAHDQRLCLEAWHINSAHPPLNRYNGGLLPDAYLYLVRKRQLISDYIKGPLVAAFRSRNYSILWWWREKKRRQKNKGVLLLGYHRYPS